VAAPRVTVLFWNAGTRQAVYGGMRFAVACGVLASSLSATACMVSVDSQALIEREEKRFTVSGSPVLNVTTFDGAIEIRSWDRAEVLVEHCVRSNGGLYYADRDEFVEALKLLLSDERLRQQLGRNGRDYVRRNYRWDVVLGKFERLFAKIRAAR